ncbi:hypothetical protein LCGC14_1192590 [marine sediment metagenome]|uniref:Uncharacterized protein n=1 Tax=marine sediment metagenome TaxID=412755 RepID=A0A0F9M6Q7_9ZZZZ
MADKDTKKEGQGRAVVLPNGKLRIDYIRDAYYNAKTGLHVDGEQKTRSEIKNAINEMLTKAGKKDAEIPYQIVFAATKTKEDPRKAAAAKAAAAAKTAKDTAAAGGDAKTK